MQRRSAKVATGIARTVAFMNMFLTGSSALDFEFAPTLSRKGQEGTGPCFLSRATSC